MNNESLELSSNSTDDVKEDVFYADDIDEDLSDSESFQNSPPVINKIFLKAGNSNHANGTIVNACSFPNGLKEVSLVFGKENIGRILKPYSITYMNVSSAIEEYGNRKSIPFHDVKEVERIVNSYVEVVSTLSTTTLSYYDDAVTSFIKVYKEGSIKDVISYYLMKANSKRKRNSSTVGVENIMCNINIDMMRKHYFGIMPNDMNFNPHDDREIFILDYIKVFWEFYMLLVFYKICNINKDNELNFFPLFQRKIQLATFTGMQAYIELELACSYGELYQELKGFKPFNVNNLYADSFDEKQQLHFVVKNSHFLNEAYIKEYNYPLSIKATKDIKVDKGIEIDLYVLKGSTDKTMRLEVQFSGQYPISRLYTSTAIPDKTINIFNMYSYGLTTDKPILYLFRQILNYSKDEKITSYYSKLCEYLLKKKDKLNRNFIDKTLAVILLILRARPNDEELGGYINKYFKPKSKQQKAEFRKLYKELNGILKPKQTRLIDILREELYRYYVW